MISCQSLSIKASDNKHTNNQNKSSAVIDSTPKVTGIGGIFFYSDNLEETKQWYTKNLGTEINVWGSSSFYSRSVDNPEVFNSL